jgi:hypothetical protein
MDFLMKPFGSDNVWIVNFAESKVAHFLPESAEASGDSVAHSARVCLTCGQPLTKRWQKLTCSKSCAAKRTPIRDQAGAANGNYRGGIATDRRRYQRRFIDKNPEKYAAQRIAHDAIRRGKLVRLTFCESCYIDCKPDAHHPDYSRPLFVRWLCKKCHRGADLAAVRMRRSA